jgi:hypothetical protein
MSRIFLNWHWPWLMRALMPPELKVLIWKTSMYIFLYFRDNVLVLTVFRFGVLSAACIGFFAVKLLSIHLDNLTWNPGFAGLMGILAIFPIILAWSLAWSAWSTWEKSQTQAGQAQSLLPAAQPLAQEVDPGMFSPEQLL